VIKDEEFIRPPKDVQRNALLNQAVKEFATDLNELDHQARKFVAGDLNAGLATDRTQQLLSDDQIMENWQIPIMQAMANIVAGNGGDVLEVGFGRGVSSSMIQEQGVASHTIIECNDSVVERFTQWKLQYTDSKIQLVHGLWQDTMDSLGLFDGIFFHTYPLNEEEYVKYVKHSVTFAEHFFNTAADHLKPGGVFTYFTSEIYSLSRSHQKALFKHFSSINLSLVPLEIPEDVKDTWWADSMVMVKAIK
jgi:guanidinoacetate N-methyltransferase